MNLLKIVMIALSIFACQSYAQEKNSAEIHPQLTIQSSEFVKFMESKLNVSKGNISFDGKFIILGEGIYGHFDMVAFDDSGKVVQKAMSADRAWRKNQASKLKAIALSMNAADPNSVEVSFHEMRVNPNAGACKP